MVSFPTETEQLSWQPIIISRSEIWTLKKPKTVSKKLKNVFRVPDLRGMLHTFKGVEARAGVWIWDSCGARD